MQNSQVGCAIPAPKDAKREVKSSDSFIRIRDVQRRIQMSRSWIYASVSAGKFPAPVQLGPKAVGWLTTEIDKWIADRVALRGSSTSN